MKSTKKVLISILIFLGVGLIFGSATYAWITLATINNIEGLSLTASSGDELQISIDGINYANSLPMESLITNPDGILLYDVTSLDGINFQTGGLREVGEAVVNEHYLSFDVWFRTSRHEHDVYLYNHISEEMTYDSENLIGTYVVSKGVSWRSPHQFFNGPEIADVVETGEIDTYYADQAIRISINELIDDTNPNDLREPEELRNFMFDPSGNPERGYGASFGQFSYFFQRTLIYVNLPTETQTVSYRLSEMDPYNPYQALDNESLVATLQETDLIDETRDRPYYQGKIRINIWIEGWDADAFDAVDKDLIKIQLQFKLAQRA